MGRALFETLLLFLTPFALYAIFLVLRLRYPLAVEHWTHGRLALLAMAGLIAALIGFAVLELSAPRGHGTYVPAHVENGVLVPGRFE